VIAVIVTRNSGEVVGQCLDGLARMAPHLMPIVVDNASTDDTLQRVRERLDARGMTASIIANSDNRGFAAAVNQAVNQATTSTQFPEHVLLLNPDVNLLTAVDTLVEASTRYGLSAGKLVDLDGRAQAGFTIRRLPTAASLIFELFGINRLWPSNSINRRYRYLEKNLDEAGDVEQPAGAFLMVRGDAWQQLGGLDEEFHPVWFEDVDFCRRAIDAGYQIQYLPKVIASHVGGHSVAKVPAGCRAVYWCVSLIKYASKHFREPAYRLVCAAVVLSSFPRAVAGMILERSLAPISTYSKIVRFAGLRFVSRRRGMNKVR
jgi:N-acetylglucosaminyl-diphospho-decaprenol L-rhamnosyltransferase